VVRNRKPEIAEIAPVASPIKLQRATARETTTASTLTKDPHTPMSEPRHYQLRLSLACHYRQIEQGVTATSRLPPLARSVSSYRRDAFRRDMHCLNRMSAFSG